MEFDEVSLVNRPANQLSKVVLFKSAEEPQMPHAKSKVDEETDDHHDEDEEYKSKMKKGDEDAVTLPAEVYEYIEALESANSEMVDELTKMADFVESDEDIMKSADPAIVEIVKAAEERAEAAESIAKAERDFRLEREFVAKAETLDNLAVDAEEFGPVLKAAAEVLDESVLDAVMTVLKAANDALGESGLFTEVGKSSSFEGDNAIGSIEKAAARIREEDSGLTHAQAVAKAVEADPSLYTEYRRGN
jgi:hypothetical protein